MGVLNEKRCKKIDFILRILPISINQTTNIKWYQHTLHHQPGKGSY